MQEDTSRNKIRHAKRYVTQKDTSRKKIRHATEYGNLLLSVLGCPLVREFDEA